MMKFNPKKVKEQRLRMGLSQEGFANLLEVSTVTIHYWEEGDFKPNYLNLEKLCQLTGKDSAYYHDLD